MTENLFLALVAVCFVVFMGALAWAQMTTPSRLEFPDETEE